MGLAMNASREKVGAGPRKSGPRRSARLRGKTSLLARAARLRTEKLARPHQMANGPRVYAHGTRTGSMTSSTKKKRPGPTCSDAATGSKKTQAHADPAPRATSDLRQRARHPLEFSAPGRYEYEVFFYLCSSLILSADDERRKRRRASVGEAARLREGDNIMSTHWICQSHLPGNFVLINL